MNLQTEHDELMSMVNPLIDFMIKNGYHFLFVSGKDNICTRHLKGDYSDVTGMLTGMCKENKQVAGILKDVVRELK